MYIIELVKRISRLPKYYVCQKELKKYFKRSGKELSKVAENYIFIQAVIIGTKPLDIAHFVIEYYK